MLQQKYNKTVQVQVTIIPRQPGKELSVYINSITVFNDRSWQLSTSKWENLIYQYKQLGRQLILKVVTYAHLIEFTNWRCFKTTVVRAANSKLLGTRILEVPKPFRVQTWKYLNNFSEAELTWTRNSSFKYFRVYLKIP